MSDSGFKQSFGLCLADHRKEMGMTQAQLAQQVGVSQSTIGMYEAGQRLPNVFILARISKVLWIRADKLIPDVTPVIVEDIDQMDIFDIIEEEL